MGPDDGRSTDTVLTTPSTIEVLTISYVKYKIQVNTIACNIVIPKPHFPGILNRMFGVVITNNEKMYINNRMFIRKMYNIYRYINIIF